VALAAIGGFLGVQLGVPAGLARPTAVAGGLLTILFTDMVGSTDVANALGDEAAQELRREHDTIVRQALSEHGGHEVKHTGDGIMATFLSATAALGCAIAIQRACDARNEAGGTPLRVRVGINAGEPVAEAGDLFGTSVIVASRIMSQADGGEILVSNVVRELCAGRPFLFGDRGLADLKGFDEPMRIYEVRWR
jgi:adenylate cyclase